MTNNVQKSLDYLKRTGYAVASLTPSRPAARTALIGTSAVLMAYAAFNPVETGYSRQRTVSARSEQPSQLERTVADTTTVRNDSAYIR